MQDLSVLLGPNDSGKTHVLEAVEMGLSGQAGFMPGRVYGNPPRFGQEADHLDDFDPAEHGMPGGAFFAQLTTEERQFVFTAALDALIIQDFSDEDEVIPTDPKPIDLHQEDFDPVDPSSPRFPFTRLGLEIDPKIWSPSLDSEEDVVGGWAKLLHKHLKGRRAALKDLLGVLPESRLVAFELDAVDGMPSWLVYWCLSDEIARSHNLEGTLDRARHELHEFEAEHSFSEPYLSAAGVPPVLVPIGRLHIPFLPVPVRVPHSFDALRATLEAAGGELLRHTRPPEDDAPQNFAHADPWLIVQQGGHLHQIHSYADRLCAKIAETIAALLPEFVARDYSVDVSVTSLARWAEGPRLDLQLVRRADGTVFPLERIADGYRIWLQLGLLETADVMREYAALLEFLYGLAEDTPPGSEWSDYEHALEVFESPVSFIEDLQSVPPNQPSLTETYRFEMGTLFALVELLRGRLYLIDEPEQHLHPRLQRHASRWLAEAMDARRSQCIVTTHSVPLLNVGGGAQYAYLARGGAGATVHAFTPDELDALSLIADVMGFNRGELLSSVVAFLFVEGRSDAIVLETLFGAELRDAGIAVTPIHSVAKLKAIPEADALFRFTSAPIVAMVDSLTRAEIMPLFEDDADLEAALTDKRTELVAVAQLRKTALAAERDIHVVGIGVPDVFDLLDEDVIQELSAGAFPGHEAARSAACKEREASGTGWKKFYERAYGLPIDRVTFERAALRMAERRRKPQALKDVLLEVERLALTIDTAAAPQAHQYERNRPV